MSKSFVFNDIIYQAEQYKFMRPGLKLEKYLISLRPCSDFAETEQALLNRYTANQLKALLVINSEVEIQITTEYDLMHYARYNRPIGKPCKCDTHFDLSLQ